MPSLGFGRLALRCWLEQDEIRPMMQIKSADFPTRRCMWNAPNPPAIGRSIRQAGFGGKTLRAFEAKVLSGYSIRPVFTVRGRSSIGRAPRLQRGGCRFEPGRLHFISRLRPLLPLENDETRKP